MAAEEAESIISETEPRVEALGLDDGEARAQLLALLSKHGKRLVYTDESGNARRPPIDSATSLVGPEATAAACDPSDPFQHLPEIRTRVVDLSSPAGASAAAAATVAATAGEGGEVLVGGGVLSAAPATHAVLLDRPEVTRCEPVEVPGPLLALGRLRTQIFDLAGRFAFLEEQASPFNSRDAAAFRRTLSICTDLNPKPLGPGLSRS